jgi:hypothetical protein
MLWFGHVQLYCRLSSSAGGQLDEYAAPNAAAAPLCEGSYCRRKELLVGSMTCLQRTSAKEQTGTLAAACMLINVYAVVG